MQASEMLFLRDRRLTPWRSSSGGREGFSGFSRVQLKLIRALD